MQKKSALERKLDMREQKRIDTQGSKPTHIGGQAVIEGVMMRGRKIYAMAVRNTSGGIEMEQVALKPVSDKYKIMRKPILRGVVSFVDSLVMGMKIITRSAEMAGFDVEEEEPGKFEKFLMDKFGDKLNDIIMGFSVFLSVILAVGLFMVLPVWIGNFFNRIALVSQNSWLLGIIEGFIRLGIFVLYIYLISKNSEIQRVFKYHGAEHKTINCFEHEEELTVENVQRYSRFHRRCGTSFLFLVMLISMVFFLFVNTKTLWLRLLTRVLFVPFIAGVSYEVIRWAGKSQSRFVTIVSMPGMYMQKMTTNEPDADQIECAIAAMNAVIASEEEKSVEHTAARGEHSIAVGDGDGQEDVLPSEAR